MNRNVQRMVELHEQCIPIERPEPIGWAEENVKLPSSARSKTFHIDITPWIRDIILAAVDTTTRIGSFCKPVQSGGSVAGEVILLYWMKFFAGFLQYNWSTDKRAKERWESRIEAVIKACKPIAEQLNWLDGHSVDCEIDLGNVFFRMQGAFVPDNLDSDSVSLQLNEEVHSWEPGHLRKARNRGTAVWNAKSFDISNASKIGDQFHQAFLDGTRQVWQVKCPGCSNRHHEANAVYHTMRSRWEELHPELGGLRYDSDKAKMVGGYNYNVVKQTLRYQMPCGYIVHDDPMERRALSLSGRYSPPREGADLSHKSWTYDAVTVDYIDWLQLVKDKHNALRARRLGNPDDWYRYVTEREAAFYDPDDIPIVGQVTLSKSLRKNRDGLPEPRLRLFALDRQQGKVVEGEVPHWWLLIRDVVVVGDKLKSLLVFEGKVETDEGVIEILDEHKCNRWQGVADSGDDTMHVYAFCLKYGINAIKGGGEQWYVHQYEGKSVRRIFARETPLHAMINRPPMFPYHTTKQGKVPDPREPLFWLYSKHGIRERLYWLRGETEWLVPADVSEDYRKHLEAEERQTRKHPRTGELIAEWIQLKPRNDQFVNECYIAMQIEQAGLIREQPTEGKKE